MEGADVAQLRALASQLTRGADRPEATAKTVRPLGSSDTHWRGADAQRCRSDWNGASAHARSDDVFDKSTDHRFADVKQSMKNFEGTVTVVSE